MARDLDKARGISDRKRPSRHGPAAVAAVALALAVMLLAAGSAAAATVSGVLKDGAGYQVVLVQANGRAAKAAITDPSGAFALKGVKLNKASLHLVQADGLYFGPVVVKASGAKAYCTIKGAASLRLGAATLKAGYALVAKVPRARYFATPPYTVTARGGKPLGAGNLGRVKTGKPLGYKGAGADLDRDGVVGAFDIDDNGNRIIDNVDRTGRGNNRPSGSGARAFAAATRETSPTPAPPGPPALCPEGSFYSFSQLWMTGAQQVNANISTITDIDALVARTLPTALKWGIGFPSGDSAQLDGLGNSYIREHTLNGVTYPRVNDAPPTYTAEGLLNLTSDPRHPGGGGLQPGALPSEIGSGDSFVLVDANGVRFPGNVNFVFNTAPAVKSYQFDTDAAATEAVYDENGVFDWGDGRPHDSIQFMVPRGASRLTLTIWRPQRKAAPGEPAGAGGWVDIGGLWYSVDLPGPPRMDFDDPGSGTSDPRDAYSNATANGVPAPPSQWEGGLLDPIADLPSDPANTISFTLDLAKCFSSWPTLGPGAWFSMGLSAKGGYGDMASIGLWFVLE
jgi:hypothetical protein